MSFEDDHQAIDALGVRQAENSDTTRVTIDVRLQTLQRLEPTLTPWTGEPNVTPS